MLIGVIDVASDTVETPGKVVEVIAEVMKYVPKERIVCGTNCGMAPMHRDIAEAKLAIALGSWARTIWRGRNVCAGYASLPAARPMTSMSSATLRR